LTNNLTGETESAGKTNAVKIGVLMVWQKQDGRWKLREDRPTGSKY
jgi:ketosteroid isomerase-like protein